MRTKEILTSRSVMVVVNFTIANFFSTHSDLDQFKSQKNISGKIGKIDISSVTCNHKKCIFKHNSKQLNIVQINFIAYVCGLKFSGRNCQKHGFVTETHSRYQPIANGKFVIEFKNDKGGKS